MDWKLAGMIVLAIVLFIVFLVGIINAVSDDGKS